MCPKEPNEELNLVEKLRAPTAQDEKPLLKNAETLQVSNPSKTKRYLRCGRKFYFDNED